MLQFDRFITLCFYNYLACKPKLNKLKIPILMYHSISNDFEKKIPYYYRIVTSPEMFKLHMQYLYENGYKVIDLESVHCLMNSKIHQTKRYVVVTFDDGYHDFLIQAWPVLNEFGYRATVFLPASFIDKNRKSFNGRYCLTWPEVRELKKNGISFGSHSMSHSVLYGMPWTFIRKELLDSRHRIEDELQSSVTSFCYPYAFPQEDLNFVKRFQQELIDTGYHCAVTTIIGRISKESNKLTLSRIPVNQLDNKVMFKAKLSGAYDWMGIAQYFVRYLKFHFKNHHRINN